MKRCILILGLFFSFKSFTQVLTYHSMFGYFMIDTAANKLTKCKSIYKVGKSIPLNYEYCYSWDKSQKRLLEGCDLKEPVYNSNLWPSFVKCLSNNFTYSIDSSYKEVLNEQQQIMELQLIDTPLYSNKMHLKYKYISETKILQKDSSVYATKSIVKYSLFVLDEFKRLKNILTFHHPNNLIDGQFTTEEIKESLNVGGKLSIHYDGKNLKSIIVSNMVNKKRVISESQFFYYNKKGVLRKSIYKRIKRGSFLPEISEIIYQN